MTINDTIRRVWQMTLPKGWRLYLANCPMKPRVPRTTGDADAELRRMKRNGRVHAHKAKDALYRRQKGCCYVCGQHFETYQMQCHHLLPQNRYPELGSVRENMALVCPACHKEIHDNPFLNSRLMVQTACRLNVDLTKRYEDS